MLRVGLTGGIASGKSNVAGIFSELGAFVVDADHLAHRLIHSGQPAYDEVVKRFGRQIVDDRGEIDRKRLGRLVFGDSQARAALNGILHPRVRAEAERQIAEAAAAGSARIALFDAALLVETGAFREFERLVVVCCARETQIERMIHRDGLSRDEALARIEAQAPLERKVALADYVIDTDGPRENTRRQTEAVFRRLLEDAGGRGR